MGILTENKDVFVKVSYVFRKDDNYECYSRLEKYERKQLAEMDFSNGYCYKAPEGMTKKEVATLISYYYDRYLTTQFSMRYIKDKRERVGAIKQKRFDFIFDLRRKLESIGFVWETPKTEEDAKNLLELKYYDTFDKGMKNSNAAKNYAQWGELYKNEALVGQLLNELPGESYSI